MPFFKWLEDGSIVINGGKKHPGEDITKLARSDPKFLSWALRERGVGLPSELFAAVEEIMRTNGVPFVKKVSRGPRRARKRWNT